MTSPVSSPAALGEWRKLDAAGRVAWLERARLRAFEALEAGFRPSPRRSVTIDGNDFDDLTGFFCAIGEAINGPGGYFGARWQGFDDCLFGGFGLESPCTITWLHSARSRALLDSNALAQFCAEQIAELDAGQDAESLSEERAWLLENRARAERGERALFDEIVDAIASVSRRSGRNRSVELRLT